MNRIAKRTTCLAASIIVVSASLSLAFPATSRADEDVKSWWTARFRGPMVTRVGKNHELVKNAFSEITEKANASTVRIYTSDSQIALGLVIDQAGHIITKASELPRNRTVECKVKGGRRYATTLVGVEEELDIALLRMKATPPAHTSLAAYATPQVGAWLAAPSGIRDVPLAVGVVSVPTRKIDQQSGVLGVMIDDAESGALVNNVIDGSAAESAGIKTGDIITAVDSKYVKDSQTLVTLLSKKRPGTSTRLTIKRGEQDLRVKAKLGRFSDIAMGEDMQAEVSGPLSNRRSGFGAAMQHDMVLRPNQCGGPVVDIEGRVVGINIARAGRVESYAIPIAEVMRALPDMMSGKVASR